MARDPLRTRARCHLIAGIALGLAVGIPVDIADPVQFVPLAALLLLASIVAALRARRVLR